MASDDLISAGHATVSNGSETVTGSGAAWSNVVEGDFFGVHIGLAVPVRKVAGNIITLAFPWPGPSQNEQPYAIRPRGSVPRIGAHVRQLHGSLPFGGLGFGGINSFADRNAAISSDVDDDVSTVYVVHSGQALAYRRYMPASGAEGYAPLTTNSGTVYWAPADELSPLHWGALGDGITSDLVPLTKMMRFLYQTPADNGTTAGAFANQKPMVIYGRNRVYAIDDSWIWGNIGTDRDTGMVYNLRLSDMRLKAVGSQQTWNTPISPGIPRQMIVAGWNFAQNYNDQVSGIYDVIIDHATFDMNFLAGATWVCNTYQFVLNEPRAQQPGIGKVVFDTSVRSAPQGGTLPFGFNTGNGAYAIIRANIEGKVGESGVPYPNGLTIQTMGTVGIRTYTNDFRFDGPVISGVTLAMELFGSAGQICNLHPWSREIVVRKIANNLMFCNGYIDYTKFTLESFNHAFVGLHWILTDPSLDRGVDLVASATNETGKGLLFCGCTFASVDLDINFITSGTGTWAAPKRRKITIEGCKYGDGHGIDQIERFEDKHGVTTATGDHWFSTGDPAIGETRIAGDTVYVGKDRVAQGDASLQLQTQTGDQTAGGLYGYASGGLGLINNVTDGFIELATVSVAGALYIHGTTGQVSIKRTLQILNENGNEDAVTVPAGNVRAEGLATGLKQEIDLTDTEPGFKATDLGVGIALPAGSSATSAALNLGRDETGSLIRGAIAGVASTGGISLASNGTWTYATTSDARLKFDFQPIDLSVIDEIDAYDFAWLAEPRQRGHGFKAQDVKGRIPNAVTGSGSLTGDPKTDEYLGMDYSKLVPILWAAVKQLREEIRNSK